MNKIATTVCATVLAVSMGSATAQDNEPRLELASKIVPVEMYACQYNDGMGPADLDKAVRSFTAYMDEEDVDNLDAVQGLQWSRAGVRFSLAGRMDRR